VDRIASLPAAVRASALLALLAFLPVIVSVESGSPSRPTHAGVRAAAGVRADPLIRVRPAPPPPAHPRGGNRRPAVIVQPHSVNVAPGGLAGFTAAASGTPAPRTQWQRSVNGGRTWTNVRGAHRVTLTFTAKHTQNGSEYRAVFTNASGRATTRTARLAVRSGSGRSRASGGSGGSGASGAPGGSGASGGSGATPAPQILVQPSDQTVESGLPATFGTVTSGVVSSVQWQISTDAGAGWSNVPNATALSYSFLTAESENGYEYRAVLSNSGGSATTRAATLTVSAPPSATAPQVTSQPADQDVTSGSYATFTTAASGSPTPSVQWQVSTNGGQAWTAILGANSTSYTFRASTQNGYEYRAVFTNVAGSATTSAAWMVVVEQSANWSGYVALGQQFSTVTGSWNAPAVTCLGGATTFSSQWIGIDGDGDNNVEQDGTEADCLNGVPTYDAWYEMYGDNNVNDGYEVELSTSTYPVRPGDAMAASVNLTGSTWTLAISDATAGWQFSIPIATPNPAPQQVSAEWILERPEINGSLSSLADFGSAAFSGATATDNATSGPISSFSNEPLQMVDSDALASPGPLISGGSGFTVAWDGST